MRSLMKHVLLLGNQGGAAPAWYELATAAHSVARRVIPSYAGNLIGLRRDSDNAEANFGFDANGDLDTAAITTWLGGANGLVHTVYDQVGSSNWTQTTAAAQPAYTASAIGGKPGVTFDGIGTFLSIVDPLSGKVQIAYSFVNETLTYTGTKTLWASKDRAGIGVFQNGSGLLVYVSASILYNAGSLLSGPLILELIKDSDSMRTIINGVQKRDDATTATLNPQALPMGMGAYFTGGAWRDFWHGKMVEMIYFDAAVDLTDLRAEQATYYGITIA